jgi:hypothetical protein
LTAQENSLQDPDLKKKILKKGQKEVVEWLKVYTLSLNPRTEKRKD